MVHLVPLNIAELYIIILKIPFIEGLYVIISLIGFNPYPKFVVIFLRYHFFNFIFYVEDSFLHLSFSFPSPSSLAYGCFPYISLCY